MRRLCIAAAVTLVATGPAHSQASIRPDNNVGFPVDWQALPTCTGLPSQPATCASSYYTSQYRLAWQDEFNFLNIAADGGNGRWFAAVHPPAVYGDWVANSTDTTAYNVTGGGLHLTSRWGKGSTTRYIECGLQSADTSGRGLLAQNFYAEARVYGSQLNATHSGIWFLSMDNGATDSTGGHTEVDMLEQYGPGDQYDHASSHIWPGSTNGTHIYASTGVARPEGKAINWHTYGLLATPTAFTIFRDGLAVRTIARQAKQQVPLYMLLTLYPNPSIGTPITASLQIDYVRVYLPN